MDTRDPLGQLLDASAPTDLYVTDAIDAAMTHAASAAQTQVDAEHRRLRRAPRVFAGFAFAFVLTGGAGAAVAAGGFEWLPWAQDPDVAYVFTLPSGRECEARVVLEQTEDYGDWDTFVAEIGRLTIDESLITQKAADIRSDPTGIVQTLDVDGQLADPTPGTVPSEDDWYASAHYIALTDAATKLSAEAGIDGWWTSDAQMQCEAVTP